MHTNINPDMARAVGGRSPPLQRGPDLIRVPLVCIRGSTRNLLNEATLTPYPLPSDGQGVGAPQEKFSKRTQHHMNRRFQDFRSQMVRGRRSQTAVMAFFPKRTHFPIRVLGTFVVPTGEITKRSHALGAPVSKVWVQDPRLLEITKRTQRREVGKKRQMRTDEKLI
jgi:hypothetical protein